MSSPGAAGLADEWELARLSAGTLARRERAGDRLRALAATVDWAKLTALLGASRTLPSLGPRILAASDGLASEEFRGALAAALETGRHQDAMMHLLSTRIVGTLAAAGIRATTLKGPQLGEAIYSEPGRRQSSDIDLLVASEDLSAAVEVVRGLEYASPADHVGASGLPLLHFSMNHERGELPPVELHWRIHWYETRFARERLLPPAPEAADGWRPDAADELATLLLYYARDGFTGLRQAVDLGAWWDRHSTEVGDGALASTARAYPELAAALAAAARAAEHTVGVPARATVPNGHGLGPRGRIAIALASRPQVYASREQLFAEIGLIDGLLTPAAQLGAFVRRQIAPPREVIREHADKAGRSRVDSTTGYALRMLVRCGMVLARLLRSGSRPERKTGAPRPVRR